MPISRDEFEKGEAEGSLPARISAFLRKDPGQAYTVEEIAKAVHSDRSGGIESVLQGYFVLVELQQMERRGLVVSKRAKVEDFSALFYAAVQP